MKHILGKYLNTKKNVYLKSNTISKSNYNIKI